MLTTGVDDEKNKFPGEIIFEDSALVVLSKQAGVVVNRAESVTGATVQDWVEQRYPKIFSVKDRMNLEESAGEFLQRSGVCHRLDKDTSGVLVVAKSASYLADVMQQFARRRVNKSYLALVHGRLEPKRGNIRLPIKRMALRRKLFGVDVDGKMAETEYEVVNYFYRQTEHLSLIRLTPKTGRTHQIRVHMRFLGHPLAGDELYLSKQSKSRDRNWCPRHFLHAEALELEHPMSRKRLCFKAKLPNDLSIILSGISLGNMNSELRNEEW